MRLSGHTRPYAVLGHPIGHSLSPAMHNAAFAELGMDAVYLALDIAPERLAAALPALRDLHFGGVNLTIPHKEVALPALNALDQTARAVGAANTVEFAADGRMIGHNTDGYGFLAALREAFDADPADADVVVLGAGGAGRAVALTARAAGARAVAVFDTDAARAARVAAEAESRPGAGSVAALTAAETPARAAAADWVINATPLGMKPGDASPLGPEAFRAGQRAFDLIYMQPETVFMRAAAAGGARTANGLGMLLHQGARAFEIWTGRAAPVAVMRAALRRAVYG